MNWQTKNYNNIYCPISHEVKAISEGSETSFRPVFAFLKKLYTRIKQVPSTFISFSYICTTNHMFERAIWDKLLECIFQNFEIALVKRGQFQNFQKPRG